VAPTKQVSSYTDEDVKTLENELRARGESIADLKRVMNSMHKELEKAEAIAEEIRRTVRYDPTPPSWLSTDYNHSNYHGTPIAILSDVHYGEVVKAAQTNAVNAVDTTVSARRIKLFVEHIIEIQRQHGGKIKPQGLVLPFGGDMISGSIVEELRMTDERTPEQSKQEMTDLLAGVIDNLAAFFGHLFIPAVVGNHGRQTYRTHFKNTVYHNHDWGLYMNLVRTFQGTNKIRFLVPEAFDAYFKVHGHRFFLTHGDQLGVKGGDGIIGAIGPIMRGANKIANSEAQIGRNIDTALFCHFHNYFDLQTIVVNGSVKGYDEFSRLALRAKYEPPTQSLSYVHPNWGRTAKFPIYLEPKTTAEANQVWVSWAP
jgi:hypothetical protein